MTKPIDDQSPYVDLEEKAAGLWLARRDRGFTGTEEDEFADWIAENPRRAELLAELDSAFRRLDHAAALKPAARDGLDADLLIRGASPTPAPQLTQKHAWWFAGTLAAAASIAIGAYFSTPQPNGKDASGVAVLRHVPTRQVLADGSVVELRKGSRIEVNFTPHQREIRLLSGEGHFTVTKDANRPFIVRTDKLSVEAIGTVFDVDRQDSQASILVTEGRVKVKVDPTAQTTGEAMAFVSANERVVVTHQRDDAHCGPVTSVDQALVSKALDWRHLWLEFTEMRLSEVTAEFNRSAAGKKLTIVDERISDVTVSGTFKADGQEAFVRLLESSFGIEATRSESEIRLRKAP